VEIHFRDCDIDLLTFNFNEEIKFTINLILKVKPPAYQV